MKAKVALLGLLVACVGLAVAFVNYHKKATAAREQAEAAIRQLSNEWNQATAKLTVQYQRQAELTNALQASAVELEKATKQVNELGSSLARAEAEAKVAAATAEAAKAELAKRDARIAELENQNSALDKQTTDMKTAITALEARIAETQKKLAASEGDRDFLLKELKRMQAEKADLERKFNDLVVLREQVHKLKEELTVARRLDWLRKGLYGQTEMKGAERLRRGFQQPTDVKTNYSLNVEIKKEGSATVVPPTNAPPAPAPNK
jgi:chromosome segregation ATPase